MTNVKQHSPDQIWCRSIIEFAETFSCLWILRWRPPPPWILLESGIFGHSYRRIASVYPPTKFDTNTFIGDRNNKMLNFQQMLFRAPVNCVTLEFLHYRLVNLHVFGTLSTNLTLDTRNKDLHSTVHSRRPVVVPIECPWPKTMPQSLRQTESRRTATACALSFTGLLMTQWQQTVDVIS